MSSKRNSIEELKKTSRPVSGVVLAEMKVDSAGENDDEDVPPSLARRKLLRVRTVAPIIGQSVGHTYLLIERKILPSVRIGASVRVPADALERWLDEQMNGGVA